MHHGSNPILDNRRTELRRERVEADVGVFCDLVAYDLENYGYMEVAEGMEVDNASFRRARSMMPFQYLDVMPSDFKWGIYGEDVGRDKGIANHFLLHYGRFRQEGYGLYIYSRAKGSGKTMLACCLANALMQKRDICTKFISVPEFLEMTKKKYGGGEVREDIEAIEKSELLIMDDIGTEMKKEWVDTELFRLVDSRYNNKRVTVFTSNMEPESLKLDGRIVERINYMCLKVRLPEVSIRDRMAKQEHDAFLRKLKMPH